MSRGRRPPRRSRNDSTRPTPARPAPPSTAPMRSAYVGRVRQPGETRDEYIARIAAAAPPLSEAQRARLRPVFASTREPARAA